MDRIKRDKYLSLVICFVVAICMVGFCTAAGAQTAVKDKTGWPKKIVIATGGGGESGPNYPMSAALGRMMEKYLGVSAVLTPTSGHDATQMMHRNDAQIGFPNLQAAADALHGTGPVAKLGPTPFRAMAQAAITQMPYVTLAKSGIKTFADLKGKTVCIGPSATQTARQMFEALAVSHNIDPKSVRIVVWDRATEPWDGLQAGRFDAVQITSAYPGAAMQEFFLTNAARIIDIGDEHIASVRKKLPWLVKTGVGANAYKGVDKPARFLGIPVFMTTIKSMPDSLVYEMTKLVYDRNAEFASFHPSNKEYKASDVGLIVDICPYHNGAIKYYREKGIWTKEMDRRQAASLKTLPESAR